MSHETIEMPFLLADSQQAQLLLLAGFILLGWVLARRQIRSRRRLHEEAESANVAMRKMREHRAPTVPLSDAPAETQRWQVALFDLQRELKAELDTRIAVVHSLVRQADQRIEELSKLTRECQDQQRGSGVVPRHEVWNLRAQGLSPDQIADRTGIALAEVERALSTLPSPRQAPDPSS